MPKKKHRGILGYKGPIKICESVFGQTGTNKETRDKLVAYRLNRVQNNIVWSIREDPDGAKIEAHTNPDTCPTPVKSDNWRAPDDYVRIINGWILDQPASILYRLVTRIISVSATLYICLRDIGVVYIVKISPNKYSAGSHPALCPIQPFADKICMVNYGGGMIIVNIAALTKLRTGMRHYRRSTFVERNSVDTFTVSIDEPGPTKWGYLPIGSKMDAEERKRRADLIAKSKDIERGIQSVNIISGILEFSLHIKPDVYAGMMEMTAKVDKEISIRYIRPHLAYYLSRDIVTETLKLLVRYPPP